MKKIYELQAVPFIGFYETYWNGENDFEWALNDYQDTYGVDANWDNYDADWGKYRNDVGEKYGEYYVDLLNQILGVDMEYVGLSELWSPREYNFNNDKIYFHAEFDMESLSAKLIELMETNKDWISKVIARRHTSKDGFWSFMDNEYDKWIGHIRNCDTDYIGYALSYIAERKEPNIDYIVYLMTSDGLLLDIFPTTDEAKSELDAAKKRVEWRDQCRKMPSLFD